MSPTWTEYCHGYRQLESYWQRGFDDGYAGNPRSPPTSEGEYAPINRGYLNGYQAGRQKRLSQQWSKS